VFDHRNQDGQKYIIGAKAKVRLGPRMKIIIFLPIEDLLKRIFIAPL
jgi:hypothetical protein